MVRGPELTLRLIMPQWQGGNVHDYYFGSELLAWLAPVANGPVETVPVPEPKPGETLDVENGIVTRAALLQQAPAARHAIEKHRPDRIVTLGGDCLIDLAPMAYLNTRYGGPSACSGSICGSSRCLPARVHNSDRRSLCKTV